MNLTTLTRLRLCLSYQRYALLLLGGSAVLLATLVVLWPREWWLWGGAALVLIKPIAFGVEIWRRFPRKLRATVAARRRIANGRFRPASVRPYCSDPCFRVVARELLRQAGVPPGERRSLLRRFAAELEAEDRVLVRWDHASSVRFSIEGTDTTRS